MASSREAAHGALSALKAASKEFKWMDSGREGISRASTDKLVSRVSRQACLLCGAISG